MSNNSKIHLSNNMTLTERHEFIMSLLRQSGSVSVSALAEQLKVSEVTIRKDLNLLERKNMLYRAHGSAILINPYINDRHVNEKEQQSAEEKRAIGQVAAKLITPNDTILIASGTTMMALAREIEPQGQLTTITSALNVAMILAKHEKISIIQLGGIIRNSSGSTVGPYAEQMLDNFSCSKLYIGIDGLDLDFGMSTTNMMEAKLNQAMMRSAQKTIVLADATKFGRKGFAKICDTGEIDQIITDSRISSSMYQMLIDSGIEVTIAE